MTGGASEGGQAVSSGGPLEIVVTVAASHLAGMDAVASALIAHGLEDLQVLEAVGVITGSVAEASAMSALRDLDGVEAVEVSRSFRVSPPEDPLQ